MTTIIGLGNPGSQYAQTRHNAGHIAVDEVAQELGARWQSNHKLGADIAKSIGKTDSMLLVKSQGYMNESGQTARAILEYYQDQGADSLQNLYVCHDDLDLELGAYKIQFGTGPKVHNGLLSLYEALGTDQFWHVRLGIDERQGDRTIPGKAYVLEKFSQEAIEKIRDMIKKEVMPELIE